jgi:nucleoside-diphosphate-sugar epimerase
MKNDLKTLRSAIVTGPTGVIGTALVEKLISENIHVYAVCRPDSKRLNVLIPDPLLTIVQCDLNDLKKLPELIAKNQKSKTPHVDMFFHLGWLGTASRENRFDMYLQTENIRQSLDAVEAAHALECSVFVGSGSQAEYGKVPDGVLRQSTFTAPESGYGMAKLCAGQMTRMNCRKYGIRHVWPRVLSVYGKHDGQQTLISTVISKFQAREKLSMTAGEQQWDYLYSGDAAAALYAMALYGKDGSVYAVGSGRTETLRHFVEIIRNIVDPSALIGFGEVPYLKDQVMRMQADITELTADTGWKPTTSFEDGIRKMIAV